MKIERNGIEIELTEQEMISAYYEQQHKWDVEYITGNLLEQYVDGTEPEKDRWMAERLTSEPNFADRVAYKYRDYLLDAYGSDTEWEDLHDAYDYICKCNGENPYPDLQKHMDRLKDEFNDAIKGMPKISGCYEVQIEYDGETYWTEGDVHRDTTWSDFYDWLIDDMNEAEWLVKYWTTKIISIEYTGIDDPDVFEEEFGV